MTEDNKKKRAKAKYMKAYWARKKKSVKMKAVWAKKKAQGVPFGRWNPGVKEEKPLLTGKVHECSCGCDHTEHNGHTEQGKEPTTQVGLSSLDAMFMGISMKSFVEKIVRAELAKRNIGVDGFPERPEKPKIEGTDLSLVLRKNENPKLEPVTTDKGSRKAYDHRRLLNKQIAKMCTMTLHQLRHSLAHMTHERTQEIKDNSVFVRIRIQSLGSYRNQENRRDKIAA